MKKTWPVFGAEEVQDRIIEDVKGLNGIAKFWKKASESGHGDPPCETCDRIAELDAQIEELEGENRILKVMLKTKNRE